MFRIALWVSLFSFTVAAQQPASPGAKHFANRCAGCHGLDGAGGEQAPSILGYARSHSGSDLAALIRSGIPGKAMPAFRLPEDELRELVSHARRLAGAPAESGEITAAGSTRPTAPPVPPARPVPEKWQGGSAVQPSRLTLRIKDYATMPMTGAVQSARANEALLARVNFLREEPGGSSRLFVNDLNGPLYILDKKTRKLVTYLDFDGRENRTGLFDRFTIEAGLANGLINFVFDPDYRRNGRFYTLHLEDTKIAGSLAPDIANFPRMKIPGYSPTEAIPTPGPITREAVIIEWTDSNISNATFEGSAREVMRVQLNLRQHPMGEMIFSPTARRGDPDWRVMYIGCGDGGSGESRDVSMRSNPQRLDNLVGKILRIVPDPEEHKDSSVLSENGRYRIPKDNPFFDTPGARKEIWAIGLRNANRLSWDVDPADRRNNHLIASTVGLGTWETVVVIRKGANYGYSEREGNQQLHPDNTLGPLPAVDRIPVRIDASKTSGTVVPTYPVIQYGHAKEGGDAISSGFVYRGNAVPALRGKFVFSDITTGRIWYANFKDMLAADDGDPTTMAPIHEMKILWSPSGSAEELYSTMAPITSATYHARGGTAPVLPSQARISGGRSDIRFTQDGSGELYILSKSDGMIRAVVGAVER